MRGTYSNLITAPPLNIDAIRRTHGHLSRSVGQPLFGPRPFIPDLRVDRRARRAWVEGVEVKRAPVDGETVYHMPAFRGPIFTEPEMFIAADPLRVVRRLRRHVARKGHRGRRGAVRVPLAEMVYVGRGIGYRRADRLAPNDPLRALTPSASPGPSRP